LHADTLNDKLSCYNYDGKMPVGWAAHWPTGGISVIVYIWGNLTSDNFTPRPGKDTSGRSGQSAGLSAVGTIPSGRKSQGIDTDKLSPPLKAIPDDPTQGGTAGHFAIAPVDNMGEVDGPRLEDWAKSRGTGETHMLTQSLLDAVVEANVKGDSR